MPQTLNVLAQGGVDQGFVVSTARGVDLLAEPIDYLFVKAQRDGGLAGGRRHNGTAGTGLEVIGGFHGSRLVLAALARTGLARGNYANGIALAVSIDHDEDTPKGVHANRHETLFVVPDVLDRYRAYVLEDGDCIRKLDAVLSEIPGLIVGVPLEPHAGQKPMCF